MNGMAVAGSILCDVINEINSYPVSGDLTQIKSVKRAVGGCVPNVAIDLKTLDPSLDVQAIGKVGNDADGEFVLETMKSVGVDVSPCKISPRVLTSFTQVMSVEGGQRTFFTCAGASAEFGYEDIDWQKLNVKMLHLGYFLLLDKVDSGDGLRILHAAKERGIRTSIDLVSENTDRYEWVLPCLKYTDNLIINEDEAGRLANIRPERKNLLNIAEKLMSYGVKERVIIHLPEIGVCLSERGYSAVPSFDLDTNYIKGTTGAGDAFCAGTLLGIYKGLSDDKILSLASMSAAAALSAPDAVSGLKSEKEIVGMCERMERRNICL